MIVKLTKAIADADKRILQLLIQLVKDYPDFSFNELLYILDIDLTKDSLEVIKSKIPEKRNLQLGKQRRRLLKVLGIFGKTLELKKKKVYKKKTPTLKKCPTCNLSFWAKTGNRTYCRPHHNPNHIERKRLAKRASGRRVPKWQNKTELHEFYKNCPEGYVVDHVIPLNHPDVWGLHVIENLQYLSKEENQLKSNLWDGSWNNHNWKTLLK